MMYDIEGSPIPQRLPYSQPIQAGCQSANFPPCVAYAVAWRETIRGEQNGSWQSALSIESSDGGRGLFQLTSSYPADWIDVDANVRYALANFLVPALHFFAGGGLRGDDLVHCVAAAFNEGKGAATLYHLAGDVDLGTTGADYGADVLRQYKRLITNQDPL